MEGDKMRALLPPTQCRVGRGHGPAGPEGVNTECHLLYVISSIEAAPCWQQNNTKF